MIQNGVRGNLEAAIPPVTGPSWVSFMTGVGPGKHGIFDFVQRVPDSVKRRAITYQDIRTKTLWDYLNEAGRSIGVVNLPVTYPAPEVNGFVIPGLLTPNADGEFAYPKGLMAEIRNSVGDYVLDVWWQRYGEAGVEKFLKDLLNCTRQRIKTFCYLLEKKDWDFFMGVFIGTDRIQHYLWPYIHPSDSAQLSPREAGFVSLISDYYKRVDEFFGYLMDHYGDDVDIFVISDHGFGPLKKKIYINSWLVKKGYQNVQGNKLQSASLKKRIITLLRPVIRSLDKFGLRTRLAYKYKIIGRMSAYNFLDCIDWSKTKAYSASNTEQGIYINLQGREPNGIIDSNGEYTRLREEIIQQLRAFKDPENGKLIKTTIFKRENLYEGQYVENAPDIILFLEDGEYLIDVQLKETLYEKAGWQTGLGTHRIEGIFIAHGPNIKKGLKLSGTRIIDMTPTLLYLQDLPIPEDMDGKLLSHIFNEDFLTAHPVSYTSDKEMLKVNTSGEQVLSNREMDEIEEKLKGLGYL